MEKGIKLNGSTILAIALLAILGLSVFGVITLPQLGGDQGSIITPPTTPTTPPSGPQTGMVSVTKTLTFVPVNELGGGSLKGNTLYIYDTDGRTILETLTISDGKATTSNTYPSNKQLWIKYENTTSNSFMFWQITVPQMTQADAQSASTNVISIKAREGGIYTDNLMTSMGKTFTEENDTLYTEDDGKTGTMTYSFYTATDKTGTATFRDPYYNLDMEIILWAKLSGTDYSSVTLTGFDGGFEKGTAMYYYKVVDPNSVAKYQVANEYIYNGAGSVSFGYNAIGVSESSDVNLTLTLTGYSNRQYMQQYGSFGPYSVELAEESINILLRSVD